MINKRRLIKLTQDLIRIDSQNPNGNEYEIARWVKTYLGRIGIPARLYEFRPKRTNVVATMAGQDKTKSLLITPHLDTVPAGSAWKFDPFAGKIKGAKMYGLGATDCKGNLACALEVINSLVEEKIKLGYDLVFAATANEESGSEFGLIALLDKGILKPTAAMVLDADDFEVVVTQKGLIHLKIIIRGIKAHGAYPWLGVNAIDIALKVLAELKCMKSRFSPNKFLKPPTMNIGTIRGGDKVNVVADRCEFELDFRYLPGMSADTLLKAIRKITAKHAKKFAIEIDGVQKPYDICPDHPMVLGLQNAGKKFKVTCPVRGSEGATVITFFQDKSIPAIATGFGSEGMAHMADEYVLVDNLYKGSLVLEEFLKNYKFS
ncbi:MAG: M20 family metallopeptidase [Candidatus Omnitrophica bacterium]|nr:M20 family metallopeptidase [Candidatus Omnitrophota bacterium]